MTWQIEYAYFCHTGNVRVNNEDNYWCCGQMLPADHTGDDVVRTGHTRLEETGEGAPCFAVFDGMGGESCGEMASFLGAQALDGLCGEKAGENPEDFWKQACHEMNRAVCTWQEENRVLSMGSTVAAVRFAQDAAWACNLGDSRIYSFREGELAQISRDHVMGRPFYGKAPLTQYLGFPEEEMLLEPAVAPVSCAEGLTLLLCSDGVTDMVTEQEIGEILGRSACPETAARELLEAALKAGGRDNATAVLLRLSKDDSAKTAQERGFLARLRERLGKRRSER